MAEDRLASVGAAGIVPSAVTLWRLRLSGGLLVTGAVVTSAPSSCRGRTPTGPQTASVSTACPRHTLPWIPGRAYSLGHRPLRRCAAAPLRIVWLALLVGLPLAFSVLGVHLLLARDRAVRGRWKVLVIFASIVAFCATLLLAAVMGFAAIDSTAAVRPEVGEWAALFAPLAVLISGIVMPARMRRVR